jgi:competence protein ComGC
MRVKKLIKSQKGGSLIEVLVGLTVLCIISVPLMMGFMGSILYSKNSERIINESIYMKWCIGEVKLSVKSEGRQLEKLDGTFITIRNGTSLYSGGNFKIYTGDGLMLNDYSFGISVINSFGSLAEFPDTCVYEIVLKSDDVERIIKRRISVNIMD